ncbi:MAG: hypothetical protein ACK4I8_05670, partial [Armatimonadota bacterium]
YKHQQIQGARPENPSTFAPYPYHLFRQQRFACIVVCKSIAFVVGYFAAKLPTLLSVSTKVTIRHGKR